jgi:hypothetical protein
VTRAGGDVIRIEQIGEPLVEDAVSGKMREQEKLLEEPRRMRAMPLGRAGIGHRLHHLVFCAQMCGAAFAFRAHGAEAIAPHRARIVRHCIAKWWTVALVADTTKHR